MLQATHSALTAKILEYQTERARDGTRFWQCRGCMYGRVRMKQRPLYVRGESAGLWGLAGKTEALLISPHSTHVSACCCSPCTPGLFYSYPAALCVRARERKREILREPNLLYASALQHFPDATAMWTRILWITYTNTKAHTHTGEDILRIITEHRTQKSSHLCHAGSCPPLSQHLAGGRLNKTTSCATFSKTVKSLDLVYATGKSV